MGEPKLQNREICKRNNPLCKQIVALTINGWPKFTSKSYMKSEIHTRQISPLWVNTKIFPLTANCFEDNSSWCKAEYMNVRVLFYYDDAKTSGILLTHCCFPWGQVASMAANRYKLHTKEGKGSTWAQHHLTSQNFAQSDAFYAPFENNNN